MAKRASCLCLAAALVCLSAATLAATAAAAAAAADAECTTKVGSYSQLFGIKKSDAKYVDNTKLAKKGPLRSVSLYFHKSSGCLRGAKAVFGLTPHPGMVGSSANTTEVALKLKAGETVTKAEYKSKQCIEYVKLTTNTGRSVSVGSGTAPGTLVKSAANKTGNYLVALRGYQSSSDGKPGPLQQLQFVWGTTKCPEVLSMETGSINTDPSVCAPRTDMCNEDASMNQFSYCVWNSPFKTSTCKGGCCISSGKCASSSCAISGVGRDVANMICYGTNAGFGFGGSNLCAGLACKLEVPGCTTDAFGGNCVGTVVTFGDESQILAESKRYVGAPCLDATPSDTTLDADGNTAGIEGIYMAKLWTICDCSDDPRFSNASPAAMLLNLTTNAVNNLTKNDVLLAISQVLPKVNLTETLNPTKAKDTQLFPSFTDFFKMPTMPTITLPSFITANTTSSNSSAVEIKLPDLGQLLSSLAAKANNATAAVNAAVDPAASFEAPDVKVASILVPEPSTPSSSSSSSGSSRNATKNLAEALGDLKGFLGKLGSNLNKANITTSSSSSSSDEPADSSSSSNAPVSIAAIPAAVAQAEPAIIMPAAMDPAPVQATAAAAPAAPAAAAAPAVPTAAAAAESPTQQDTPPLAADLTTEPVPAAAEPQTAATAAELEATPQAEPVAMSAAPAAGESQPAATEVEATPAATEAPTAAAAEPAPVTTESLPKAAEATSSPTTTDTAQASTAEAEPTAATSEVTPTAEAQAPQPAPAPEPAAAPALATTQGAFKGFSGSQAAIQQILGLLPPEAFMPYDYEEHPEGVAAGSDSMTPTDAVAA